MYENSILTEYEFDGYEENLSDVIGRTQEVMQLAACMPDVQFDEILFLSNCSMFLLTGPAGYGKSYLALCFAQTLKDHGYVLYRIDCDDIMEEKEPSKEWKQIFHEITVRTDPEGEYGEKIYLYLEHLNALREDRKSLKAVVSALKELPEMDCNCILVSSESDAGTIPLKILKQLTILSLDLPDEDERRMYFEKWLSFEIENPSGDEEALSFYPIDYAQDTVPTFCAEKTEGLSFGQLKQVVFQTSLYFKQKLKNISGGDFEAAYSHVKNGKGCFIEEEDFIKIISRVEQTGNFLARAEASGSRAGDGIPAGAAPVVSQPQIIYAMPPGMNGMPMNTGAGAMYGSAYGNGFDAREQLMDAADSDNPEVSVLREAFNLIPEDLGEYDDADVSEV